MSFVEIFLIGIGLSMDAFAVAICQGLSMKKLNWRHAGVIALFFGGFQAIMPLLGWFLGSQFAGYIQQFDHWVAFVLLAIIGFNMLREALSDDEDEEEEVPLTPDGKEPPVTMYPPKKLVFVVERRQGNSRWNMECLVRLTDIHACFTLPEDKEALDAALKENRRAPKYKYFKNMATPDQTVLIADTMGGKAIVYFETERKMSEYLKSVAAFNNQN